MENNHDSKSVIVTGGVRGIGREISLTFARAGHQVFATYKSNSDAAAALEAESEGKVKTYQVDGSNLQAVEQFREQLLQETKIDVLINNAGIVGDGLLLDNALAKIQQTMSVNFMGAVNFSLTFLPGMMAQRHGNIVNISSSAANKIMPGNTAYGCSKAAIERFSKGLAKEAGRFDILVNCVAPGWVETDMFKEYVGQKRKELLKSIPTRDILKPEEVAQFVADIALRRVKNTGSVFALGNGDQIV